MAFHGSFNVKYSAVIIIFLHHHVRESSTCADETHSLHGAAESFYAIVIVELVFVLIVNFSIPFCHDLCSLQCAFSVTYSLWKQLLDNQTFVFLFYSKFSTSNKASTVLDYFIEATRKYSLPSRVRSDRGAENVDVARHMNAARGSNRSSHLVGSSVHNQRTERLHRDTTRCCLSFIRLLHLSFFV